MPMITTRVSIPLPPEKERALAARLGQAIQLLGKTEKWLMLEFRDQCRLCFRGEAGRPMAFVEVQLLGSASDEAYGRMTAEITRILNEETQIAPECIYVAYGETEHWGWNGENF